MVGFRTLDRIKDLYRFIIDAPVVVKLHEKWRIHPSLAGKGLPAVKRGEGNQIEYAHLACHCSSCSYLEGVSASDYANTGDECHKLVKNIFACRVQTP